MSWHDESCPRLDLASFDGVQSCLRCGSFAQVINPFELPSIKTESDIRLLRLLPADFDEDIQCEVFVRDLRYRPTYEAISYTWADETGDTELCKSVFVSGHKFRVTRNCENALKRIRRTYSARTIWIDAICINQEDTNERGHQVQLMPRIYSRAKGVIIYIGEPANDSDFCLDTLANGSVTSDRADDFAVAADHLIRRDYFSRVWVLQEVALARRATLLCGGKEIAWTQLSQCQIQLRHSKSFSSTVPLLRMKGIEAYTMPEQLLNLLDIASSCKAQDPRDKVYSILGLALGEHGIAADYSLSVRDLYSKVAVHLAQRHGWGKVLNRAGWSRRRLESLPSWVPDWTSPVSEIADLDFADACGWTTITDYDTDTSTYYSKISDDSIQYNPETQTLTISGAIGYLGYSDDSLSRIKRLGCVYMLNRSSHLPIPTAIGSLKNPRCLCLSSQFGNFAQQSTTFGTNVTFGGSLSALECNEANAKHPSSSSLACNEDTALTMEHYRLYATEAALVPIHQVSSNLNLRTKQEMFQWLEYTNLTGWGKFENGPWTDVLSHLHSLGTRLTSIDEVDKLFFDAAADYEPPARDYFGNLWWRDVVRDPRRYDKFREMGNDCQCLMKINDAIWRLLVRLFLWTEVESPVTIY